MRCPQCHRGRIFKNGIGLGLREQCDTCAIALSGHDSGDGPAVAATFFLGFIALAAALLVEYFYRPPMWVHMAIAAPLVIGGAFVILRPLKGIMVAMQYRYRQIDGQDDNLGQM